MLNYDTPDETVNAVRSLERSDPGLHGTIVVDNGSRDGSAVRLARELADTLVIATERNEGFPAGCNRGIREALRLGADRVFLLNSDATVEPRTLAALSLALERDPVVGITGPMLVDGHDSDVVQSLGISYSAATGRMRHLGAGGRRSRTPTSGDRTVDAVSGCAMLIRREVFERIGLFAEEYFFSFEDLDFCLRARSAGFRTVCVGTSVVRHQGSLSIGRQSPQRIYFAMRNHLLLASRTSDSRRWLGRASTAATIVAINLAHTLATSEVPRRAGIPALVRGIQHHLAGRYGSPGD